MRPNAPGHIFIGNLALDDIVYPDGQTRMAAPGGNSLYAAIGANIWSDEVGLAAIVGRDWPKRYTKKLLEHGIDVSGVQARDVETMRAWALYEADGRRNYVSRNKSVAKLTPSPYSSIPPTLDEVLAFSRAAETLHLDLSPAPDDLPPEYLRYAKTLHLCPMRLQTLLVWREAPTEAATISVDILPYPLAGNLDDPQFLSLLAGVDIFMPSQAEAEYLAPARNLAQLCKDLAQRGPKIVVIKLGDKGALVYDKSRDKLQRIPAYPTNAVDLTGAGDSFCGGFSVGLQQSGNPFEAARYGAVSASFLIESFGALHALKVSRAAAEKRLAALRNL